MTKRSTQQLSDRAQIDQFWKAAGLKPAPMREKRAMILALSMTQTKQ